MVPGRLVLLTVNATLDEIDCSFVHFWLPEVSWNELDCFVLAHVSGYFGVVLGFEDFLY